MRKIMNHVLLLLSLACTLPGAHITQLYAESNNEQAPVNYDLAPLSATELQLLANLGLYAYTLAHADTMLRQAQCELHTAMTCLEEAPQTLRAQSSARTALAQAFEQFHNSHERYTAACAAWQACVNYIEHYKSTPLHNVITTVQAAGRQMVHDELTDQFVISMNDLLASYGTNIESTGNSLLLVGRALKGLKDGTVLLECAPEDTDAVRLSRTLTLVKHAQKHAYNLLSTLSAYDQELRTLVTPAQYLYANLYNQAFATLRTQTHEPHYFTLMFNEHGMLPAARRILALPEDLTRLPSIAG
jgi:hypothetical protein